MNKAVLYFDGNCILCNKSISYIINRDVNRIFKIGYLNQQQKGKQLDTIILSYNNKVFTHSNAVIKSLTLLGGTYKLMGIFFLVPKFIRDSIYKMISKNRYRWFGKQDYCPTLPEEWKKRMI